MEKQPPEVLYKKTLTQKFRKSHSETSVLVESLYNEVAGLKVCSLLIKRLQHKCFTVKIFQIFKNTYFEEHLRTATSVKAYFIKFVLPLDTSYFLSSY